jgi:hypothetical protein
VVPVTKVPTGNVRLHHVATEAIDDLDAVGLLEERL